MAPGDLVSKGRTFRFEHLGRPYRIVRLCDIAEDEVHVVPRDLADWILEGWLRRPGDRVGDHQLIRFIQELDGSVPWDFGPPSNDAGRLERWLHHATASGQLRLVALEREKPIRVAEPRYREQMAEVRPPVQRRPAAERWYGVRVLDDFGVPVSGVKLRFEIDGQPIRASTNAKGEARVEYDGGPTARLELLNLPALAASAGDRWQSSQPPAPSPPTATVVSLRDEAATLSVPSETTTLVVLTDKIWIRITLVDRNQKPVSGAAFVVIDADGVRHAGELDEAGSALVMPIARGKAKVSFSRAAATQMAR